MSESSVLEQPKIKVSKRPAIQNKVDEKTNQLRNLLPNTNDKTLNVLARKLTADEVRIERLREEARKVNIDSLTGLKNRKGFEQELRKVFSVAKRYYRPVSVLYIDLDDMRTVNNTHGHRAGDKLLKKTADIILKTFREADIIARLTGECTAARIGGDEFAVILPETSAENALIAGERLREAIESQLATSMSEYIKNGQLLTISMGCTGYPDSNCNTPEELQHQADTALYNSKRTPEGIPVKNRVTLYKKGMTMPENKSEITQPDTPEPAKI